VNLAEKTVVERLDMATQLEIVRLAGEVRRSAPMLSVVAGGRAMSVRVTNAGELGWYADERGYRYTSEHPHTGKPWPPIPDLWLEIANRIAGEHPWDCAHLVWYSTTAKLGWHRDKTERTLGHPVVTFSLGDGAPWSVREDTETPIHTTKISSGDVVVLAGESRSYFHRIDRIEPALGLISPSPLSGPGRLAVSLRVAA